MLADMRAGVIDGVVVYNLDRLHRQPKELEDFIDLCRASGIEQNLASCQGFVDLGTHHGVMTARMLGAVAAMESDDKSRRIRRKHEELAERGKRSGGGSRPYGYEPGGLVVRESEAAVIRECVSRFLAGESIRSIVMGLQAREIASASGGKWSATTLRRVLGSGRIAGLREHHKEIASPAEWPAIITVEESERIRATLADPDRRTNKAARRYLLAGLVRCGLCGCQMVARPRSGGQRRYACVRDNGGCGRMTVNADPVETLIVEAILHVLDSPELAATVARQRAEEPDAARFQLELEEAQQQLAELGVAYANKEIPLTTLTAATKTIEARRDTARKQLAKLTRTSAIDEFVGNADLLRERWESLDLSRQHAIVEALAERIVIAPALRPGSNRFDPDRVSAFWRA